MRTQRHEIGSGPGTVKATKTTIGFLQQIHHAGHMRSAVAATDAATAVFSMLTLAVSREQARTFVSAMPSTLRHLLHLYAYERPKEPTIVSRDQLLRAVADRLHIEPENADVVARIVLSAAQNWLPRKELNELKHQHPSDLQSLWAPP
jgi:uncharacterized protein (DUF2267 family)